MATSNSPQPNPFNWTPILIACGLAVMFLGIIYLAMNNEADYMPSQQKAQMGNMQMDHGAHGSMQQEAEKMNMSVTEHQKMLAEEHEHMQHEGEHH